MPSSCILRTIVSFILTSPQNTYSPPCFPLGSRQQKTNQTPPFCSSMQNLTYITLLGSFSLPVKGQNQKTHHAHCQLYYSLTMLLYKRPMHNFPFISKYKLTHFFVTLLLGSTSASKTPGDPTCLFGLQSIESIWEDSFGKLWG